MAYKKGKKKNKFKEQDKEQLEDGYDGLSHGMYGEPQHRGRTGKQKSRS